QREALVRSYTNYQTDPPVSLDPLADYLAKRPNEPVQVLLAAVDVFTASGDAIAPKATALVLNLLNRPDEPTRISAIVAIESARISLAATKPGAKLIAERFIAKKLPRDFFPQVNEAINKFADDPAFAKLRADVLRGGLLLSLEPSQVDKIRAEVNKKGNAQKGKELYL